MEEGVTVRESLTAQRNRTRDPERLAELDEKLFLPTLPEELRYLWRIYHRLRNRKGAGLVGPTPWEWPDLDAFVRNSRMPLAPWEVEILEALDDVFLASKA